jgi:very-short-patch-repair endonuclease
MPDKNHYTGYNRVSLEKSRGLRKNMTRQERRLWYEFLRNYPVKFYRQRSIDWYIVDFYCSKARLVIELDGSQHTEKDAVEYDRLRTEVLEKYGLEVLRFTNIEIDKQFDSVCTVIDQKVGEQLQGKSGVGPGTHG